MKKYLYIIIMLLTILLLSVYIYVKKITQSEKANYNYKNSILVQNDKIKESNINLNIQGTIEKRIVFGRGIEILKTFDGSIYMNKEKYNVNLGLTRDNIYFGNAFKDDTDNKTFTIFLSKDLKTIYLINDQYSCEIVSSKTIEEFRKIKEKFLK